MARADTTQVTETFEQFYRDYYGQEIGDLARKYPTESKSLFVDWDDLYRFDPDLADDVRAQPGQMLEYAEEALRRYDLPADVKLGGAHVRIRGLPETTDIRDIRHEHRGRLLEVTGIVRKATDVRPKITAAAFECQRCGTLTRIPQAGGEFQEPHECQGCERQGPFRINFDQSEFVDAQKLRIQESPEGLRGGETPQSIDVNVEDDITGRVTAGDHVTVTGILKLDQQGSDRDKSPMFDIYMEGTSIEIDDEEFEEMDITEADKEAIVELAEADDIYDRMVGAIAPSIYGYEEQKLAMALQLFSGVTKHLPDGSRIRGDLHMLLIGDPGTGKSQLLQYIRNIAPRSVYTSGKGSSSAGLTAAAVRDDFGDSQQWTLEAGALVLADKGIAAVDELDKMRCVTGETLVQFDDGVRRIRDVAQRAGRDGTVESLPNGRTIRDVDLAVWTMTETGRLETRPVTAIHEYDAPDTCKRVTLQTGERLTATPDHPFFVLADGERIEKPAARVTPGDWVCVPRSLAPRATDGGTATATATPQLPDMKGAPSEAVDGTVSEEPPTLDVVPGIGDELRQCRTALRLDRSECGIAPQTYADVEAGEATISLEQARDGLADFEQRKTQANDHLESIDDAGWDTLDRLCQEFHVSRADIAADSPVSERALCRDWGQDTARLPAVRTRLETVLQSVSATDLSGLRDRVHGDVTWRQVATIEDVDPARADHRIRDLEDRLADLLDCSSEDARDRARSLLATEPDPTDRASLRETIERHGVSIGTLAESLDIPASTLSQWFDGSDETERFDEVRDAALDEVGRLREEVRDVLTAIESPQEPSVYDLTVAGTENYVANGMVVHNSEDRSALHESLEQQHISISKAGINATLKSRCSLLGAANPKYGRFDQYEPIGEQIDLEPALISRFDLIFTVTDQPDPEEDADLADHILKTNYAGELQTHRTQTTTSNHSAEEVAAASETVSPTIEPDLLRKYIAYAKRNCFPTMTDEAKAVIREFYVDLRARGADEDAPVPVTARKLEALVRLAEASARVRLSDTVDEADADRATDIAHYCLRDIGMDPETGEFDADVVETGHSKSQRDRIKNLKALVGDIEDEYDEGAPVDVLLERAEEIGMDRSKAEHEIEQLKQKGEVYEPRTGHLRTT